jgi:hypothetical protein
MVVVCSWEVKLVVVLSLGMAMPWGTASFKSQKELLNGSKTYIMPKRRCPGAIFTSMTHYQGKTQVQYK